MAPGAVSDGTRDIWLYDFKGANHKRLTDYRGEDRNAVCPRTGRVTTFFSERGGSSNVWYSKLDGTTAVEPITFPQDLSGALPERRPERFAGVRLPREKSEATGGKQGFQASCPSV